MTVKVGDLVETTTNIYTSSTGVLIRKGSRLLVERVGEYTVTGTVGDISVGINKNYVKPIELSQKPTNPKDAVGIGKVPFSTIPANVVGEVGLALMEGARKYGRHNYRDAGVRASVYYDSSLRHLTDWWEGVDLDPDSGLSHVSKAIAGLIVLRDGMMRGNWTDDRPPPAPEGWQQDLNEKAKALLEKYPNSKEPIVRK